MRYNVRTGRIMYRLLIFMIQPRLLLKSRNVGRSCCGEEKVEVVIRWKRELTVLCTHLKESVVRYQKEKCCEQDVQDEEVRREKCRRRGICEQAWN